MRDTIRHVLNELYNLNVKSEYAYRFVLSSYVELVDPAVEIAKEAYIEMRKLSLSNLEKKGQNNFFSPSRIQIFQKQNCRQTAGLQMNTSIGALPMRIKILFNLSPLIKKISQKQPIKGSPAHYRKFIKK
jgi:hypothetical protein